ncbi:hypothetical protein EMIHUDRAFT_211435 [Emiliania huxleyi CCMP1516]|uniref:FAD-dependent urate hydroxylase HpyO FAD/NAD(P)-binding domain-containing protein n=2 Tax=Emiliania huxleyi TaxID=2903 RepID=A0A0D3IVK8_EMIH1|nr:hypothetical protein EMIHUDRAFT_211435 [Emiliania huxleyi CCMP1516]EOD15293.1 hypothetical protein EMIHUDRAFT_211435 [Emiliania huxleyi CCMP1516]|eukprot:XP_005767722.1 hypothetical protein EMIHUDRAFT_211435 [Emiliania huxleyi CCMP1516]
MPRSPADSAASALHVDAELAVIGSGPAALALLARLARDDPSSALLHSTLVIDPSGAFCTAWAAKLRSQGVSHLRSPTFVHPHPSRRLDDALHGYAAAHGRLRELRPIEGVERQWQAPSSRLFEDFCEDLAADLRGGKEDKRLAGCHVAAAATDIVPLFRDSALPWAFDIARVVLAVGDGGIPRHPDWASRSLGSAPSPQPAARSTLLHASALASALADELATTPRRCSAPTLRGERSGGFASFLSRRRRGSEPQRPRGTGRLVVVGGGLSAAQLAAFACRLGWRSVTLVSRSELTVRPFDVGGGWVASLLSPELGAEEAAFFAAPPEERLWQLREARPGGSLTPEARRRLAEMELRGAGRVLERAEVRRASWRPKAAEWEWADGWQLYVAGALSALQIGPEAFNLAGAGACAARIVERLLEDERVTSGRLALPLGY